MLNVWINEKRTNLKLSECCILDYKLSDNVVNHSYLNLIELIYSCSWKLAVIDFLFEVGSPLTQSRNAVLTDPSYRWTEFQIIGLPFSRCQIVVSVQRLFFNYVRCRLAVCYSELFFIIIVLPQNFIKLYCGLNSHKTLHISPFPEFQNFFNLDH